MWLPAARDQASDCARSLRRSVEREAHDGRDTLPEGHPKEFDGEEPSGEVAGGHDPQPVEFR